MTWLGAVRSRYGVATDPLRTERKIELTAVVLGLLLCLQLLYSGARLLVPPVFDTVAPAADVLQVKPIDRTAGVASNQSDEIRARPLFWQSRRPSVGDNAETGPDAEGEPAGQLKDFKLLGVFGSGDTAGIIALVKGNKRRILQGERFMGWTLDAVEPNRVILVDGERREELVLKTGVVIAPAIAVGDGNGNVSSDGRTPDEPDSVVRGAVKSAGAAAGTKRRLSAGGISGQAQVPGNSK